MVLPVVSESAVRDSIPKRAFIFVSQSELIKKKYITKIEKAIPTTNFVENLMVLLDRKTYIQNKTSKITQDLEYVIVPKNVTIKFLIANSIVEILPFLNSIKQIHKHTQTAKEKKLLGNQMKLF